MGQIVLNDSEGQSHVVWLQEQNCSCGPACIYMVDCEVNQSSMAGGEARIDYITELLPDGYDEAAGGTSISALPIALGQIGLPAKTTNVSNIKKFISQEQFPCILSIDWGDNSGHFTVGVKLISRTGALVCLDPIYGVVELTFSALPLYTAYADYQSQVTQSASGTLDGGVVFLL